MLKTIKSIFGKSDFEMYQQRMSRNLEFMCAVDKKIIKGWSNKELSSKYLSSYDRYLLEFKWVFDLKSNYGLGSNVTIYDENLDAVYDAQLKAYEAIREGEHAMGQMLLELEYWLSLDWKLDNEQNNKNNQQKTRLL